MKRFEVDPEADEALDYVAGGPIGDELSFEISLFDVEDLTLRKQTVERFLIRST